MFQLQLRALHNYPGTCLPSSSFGASDKCRKFAPIRCKYGRFCCSFRTKHSKIGKDFYSLRSFGDGSPSNLSLGFLNSFTPVNSFSYGSFSNGISCGLSSYGAFTKRFFSQKSLGNMGAQDGKSGGSTSPLQGSSKQRKQAKALAANGKTRRTGSGSSEEIGFEASSELLVGGGKDKNLAGSSVPTSPVSNDEVSKVKGKRKPRTKKSMKQDAADSSLLKADAAEEAKGSSRSKKPSVGKSDQDPASKVRTTNYLELIVVPFFFFFTQSCNSTNTAVSQSNVNGTPVKIADSSSSSTKLLSSKKSGKSSSKGKSEKAASNSPQKHRAQAQQVGQVKRHGQMSLKPLYPPTGKSVVVVESVTKAKVIQGYLGDMYEVLPSYGHVRDLARKSGSVRPEEDFSMVWEVPSSSWSHLKSIKVALSG